MRVPAYIRFTLAELTAFGLQSASVLAKANSAIHLVLREDQVDLPSPEMKAACWIISVEDANGITMAVLKHRDGETWDRRHKSAVVFTSAGFEIRDLHSEAAFHVKSEDPGAPPHRSAGVRTDPEPVVPRREPPHAAPPGEDRIQRGVKAMHDHLLRLAQGGPLRGFGRQYDSQRPDRALVFVEGEFCLRALAKVFLNAYQPEITISDQVRFGQAKREMKLRLLRDRRQDRLDFIGDHNAAEAEDQVDRWPDILDIRGCIDIDALAKAFWSVMKGEG